MLRQSVKPIWKAVIDLLNEVKAVRSTTVSADDKKVSGFGTERISTFSKLVKSKTVVRLSPDLSHRFAFALEKYADEIEGNRESEEMNHRSARYRQDAAVLKGDPHTWYVTRLFGAMFARDRGLPPNTIQIDIVRDGVICRNEPYTQYAFDELIRSIEHAEAQQ